VIYETDELNPTIQLARSSPAGFAHVASRGTWIPYRWLRKLNELLLEVAAGECDRVIVTAPPRHGKSELISKYTPAWWLGTFPDDKVILGSYEASFAASWGGRARDLLEEFGPSIFGIKVSGDSRARDRWTIRGHRGEMHTCGVGGPMTGKGGDLIIIDDPIKNDSEANSETIRESKWQWWQSTARTRLEPGGKIIVLQTRWHEDDLVGRILEAEPDRWRVLNLPAVAEENDALGRAVGEALCPQRFNEKALKELETAVGEYWWNALFQGRPGSVDGNIFKEDWFAHRFRVSGDNYLVDGKLVPIRGCTHFWTIDTASTLKKTSDYTAIGLWAATRKGKLLLLDVVHKRLEEPDIVPLIQAKYEATPKRQRPQVIGIEDLGIFQQAERAERPVLPVEQLEASKDKLSRSLTFAAMAKAGKVYFNEDAHWFDKYKAEHLSFPRGKHDDMVDMSSYAGIKMVDLGAEFGLSIVTSRSAA
jgi:predicted phage terminase large subunit-like protein